MTTKVCAKCREEKSLDDFHRNKSNPDGYQKRCKPCRASHHEAKKDSYADPRRAHYKANKDRIIAKASEWAKAHPERRREIHRKWRAENAEADRQRLRAIKKANPHKVNALTAKRRAGLKQRACLLTPEGEQQIKAIYGFAEYMTKKFGKPYHVDHIVPLHGKTCSGLHVPGNLRVVPAQLNLSKGAKIDYELVPHAFRSEEN